MAERIINTILQLRRGTEAQWLAVKDTFIPLAGEGCVTLDGQYASQVKFGNGTDPWGSLPYAGAIPLEDKETLDRLAVGSAHIRYEISHKPINTVVNYREDEIRITCPSDTTWVVNRENKYYGAIKIYAPDGAYSFKESLDTSMTDDTMYYYTDNEFAGIDTTGRHYSIVWLPFASFDDASNTWSYYGANSSQKRLIGWDYCTEWFDENGNKIGVDNVRINLANEECMFFERTYTNGEIDAAIAKAAAGNEEVNNKIQNMTEDGTLSTDFIIQGINRLILDGGSAPV